MKTHPCLLVGFSLFAATLWAQPSAPPPSAPPTSSANPAVGSVSNSADQDNGPSDAPQRTAEQLDQLLGPIALYPDALIAIILPAATNASDIVLASRFLAGSSDANQIDSQPWDDSVKSLARYPEVIKWMDENLEWTKQLGEAFAAQPADVMNAMQRLRTEARAAGSLVDTPQQQVVMQDDNISIVPAQADVIYVPRYDPEVVYIERPNSFGYSYVSFGPAYAVGAWLSFDCDWRQRRIWIDRRFADNRSHRDLRRPATFPIGSSFGPNANFRPWRPSPNYAHNRAPDPQWRSRPIIRPAPLPGAPGRSNNGPRNDGGNHWSNNPSMPRNQPNDGRNHGSNRRRSDAPVALNPATNPGVVNGPPTGGGISPRKNTTGPATIGSPVAPAPGFANRAGNLPEPNVAARRDRNDLNGDSRRLNPNYRAGSIERPRTLPAPGIPLDRSPAPSRSAAVLPPPPAVHPAAAIPSANRGPSVSAPVGNPANDNANDSRGNRGDRSGSARER